MDAIDDMIEEFSHPYWKMSLSEAFENYKRLETENKRLIDLAGDALGFSEYQRDRDTVEVLAHSFKKQSENYAEVVGERDSLRARCERLDGIIKMLMVHFNSVNLYEYINSHFKEIKQALEVPRE